MKVRHSHNRVIYSPAGAAVCLARNACSVHIVRDLPALRAMRVDIFVLSYVDVPARHQRSRDQLQNAPWTGLIPTYSELFLTLNPSGALL